MRFSTVLAVMMLLLMRPCGRAALARDVSYVLQPQAMASISEAFERMKPTLRYTSIAIERDCVKASLCWGDAAGAPCFVLRLEHPSADCVPTDSGQFCARFPDGPAPPEVIAVIADALRASADESIWTRAESIATTDRSVDPAALARTLGTSLALTLIPLATGLLLGSGWPRRRPQRWKGAWSTIAAIVVPPLCVLLVSARIELIGAWDALYVGLAAGAGLLLALHEGFADSRNVALLLGSCVAGVFALEVASRLALPPPPAFPSAEGPTLLLSELLRLTPERAFSPTHAGIITCRALYSEEEPPPEDWGTAFPDTWHPRPDAREHILHLGDSMVFGSGRERFTDDLNELEPVVEHVNAAIPGTAPDVYLALLRRFIAQHDFTAVVMHLTPNDYGGIDECLYPCSGWQPLLAYEPSGTRLRFPRPHYEDKSRLVWLMRNSPPPYILRASVGFSSFAAHFSAALVYIGRRLGNMPADEGDRVRETHLAAILRDARDELRARRIPFVVDIFRDRRAVEAGTPTNDWGKDHKMKQIAEDLGIVTLDSWQPLVTAGQSGQDIYVSPEDPHFNSVGHALIAAWLKEELPGAIARGSADGSPSGA